MSADNPYAAADAEARRLYDLGYRCVSRKYRTLVRLPEGVTGTEALYNAVIQQYQDLPEQQRLNWEITERGWVNRLGEESSAEQYRRVYAPRDLHVTPAPLVFDCFLEVTRRGRRFS